jgi:hypothetical protein
MKSLALLLAFSASPAFADEKPGFDLATAQQDFAAASAPSAAQLAGNWLQVGRVSEDGLAKDDDGYWPDGKAPASGYPDIYQTLAIFKAQGKNAFALKLQLIGADSHKIYDTDGPYQGALGASGFVANFTPDELLEAQTLECRLVQAKKSLLCRDQITATGKSYYLSLVRW